jgi:hypothetical protein
MIAQSVAELLADHVRLTVEGIDRMYLNVYVLASASTKVPSWLRTVTSLVMV